MDVYRFDGSRNNFVKFIKFVKTWNERELTSTEKLILIKEEMLKLKIQFFNKYQLGDPQEIENLYQETCTLIDKAITEYSKNVEATEKSK